MRLQGILSLKSREISSPRGRDRIVKEVMTLKVFIADDSRIMRERLISMLNEFNEIDIIGEAHDGLGAIEGIRTLEPDFLILDIRMPKGNGIEVLRNIKDQNLPITIAVFTNFPTPQYQTKCMALGADYFFDKSEDFEKLIGVLKGLATQKSLGLHPYQTDI